MRLIQKYYEIIEKLTLNKISGDGLAVFRVLYTLVLMCEVGHLIYYHELIFATKPYSSSYQLNFIPALLAWEIVLLLIMVGACTRTMTVINYVFNLVFLSTISTFEYHMVYMYTGINFLMMFLDISKCYSVDRLWLKLKYSTVRQMYNPEKTVSQIHYFIIQFIVLGLVYFDSVFFKFASSLWRDGLGLWLPASIPQVTHIDLSFILNYEWLVIGLGYFALIFEVLFLFLFWHRKLRLCIFLVGIGLHVGILFAFPIPWFALGVIAIYFVMVPVSLWEKIFKFFRYSKSKATFFYDGECPLCLRTRIIIESLDFQNAIKFQTVQTSDLEAEGLGGLSQKELFDNIYSVDAFGVVRKGYDTYVKIFQCLIILLPLSLLMRLPLISHLGRAVYRYIAGNRIVERCTEDNCGLNFQRVPPVSGDDIKLLSNLTFGKLKILIWSLFLLMVIMIQINVTLGSPMAKKVFRKVANIDDYVGSTYMRKIFKPLLGITGHGVFVDNHFKKYDKIIGIEWQPVEGDVIWLPIITKDGMPMGYNYGTNWANWSFRTNGPGVKLDRFKESVTRWLYFWSGKNKVDLAAGHFNFYVKRIDIPVAWQKDFLTDQKNKPWDLFGTATFKEDLFEFEFKRELFNIKTKK